MYYEESPARQRNNAYIKYHQQFGDQIHKDKMRRARIAEYGYDPLETEPQYTNGTTFRETAQPELGLPDDSLYGMFLRSPLSAVEYVNDLSPDIYGYWGD